MNKLVSVAHVSVTLATIPTLAFAFSFDVGPVHVCDTCGGGIVGGTTVSPPPIIPPVPPVITQALPPQIRKPVDDFEKGAAGVQKTVENAQNDVIATARKEGGDTLTTLAKASGDTFVTLQKAGNDTVTTVKKSGSDVVATYSKGWRDTTEQTKRSFNDTVDAGKAIARFTEAQAKGHVSALRHAASRVREGKVVDALWGAAVEPAQSSEKNFSKAVQESAVLNAAAQAAATAYGGPAGAAAYAAWYTYRATGDANLALKAGAFSIVSSYAGGSLSNMPTGTAGEVLKKAAVTGATAGIAAAAAGGDESAIKNAVLRSGGSVLVQGASDRLQTYSPGVHDALQTVQCISARDISCISKTTYAKDAQGRLLFDKNGNPRIDPAVLSPAQYVGQWTGIDPASAEGRKNAIVTAISIIPQTQSIPLAGNKWVLTTSFGDKKSIKLGEPAVVLTYVGKNPPFYSKITYKKAQTSK